MATVDDKKIIFSMVGVSKTIPQNNKQIPLIPQHFDLTLFIST